MDVSAEAADVVVREGLQATEMLTRLAGDGLKNLAALMVALAKQNYQVSGQTSARRLAQEGAPTVVLEIKSEDMEKFKKLAKDFGVLYFAVKKKDSETGIVNVVSNQNYAAQINAVMEQMGYPIPEKAKGDETPKKETPRAPREKSSPERGNGLNPSPEMETVSEQKKPSTKERLDHFQKILEQAQPVQEKTKKKTR